jgi:hypothetical protein
MIIASEICSQLAFAACLQLSIVKIAKKKQLIGSKFLSLLCFSHFYALFHVFLVVFLASAADDKCSNVQMSQLSFNPLNNI